MRSVLDWSRSARRIHQCPAAITSRAAGRRQGDAARGRPDSLQPRATSRTASPATGIPTRCCAAWQRCRGGPYLRDGGSLLRDGGRWRRDAGKAGRPGCGSAASPARSSTACRLSSFPSTPCGWCRHSTRVSCGAGTSTSPELPPGSDVRFVTPTVWEEYHLYITSGRWWSSWCRPCLSPGCSRSGRDGGTRSRRYARARRHSERATAGFSRWPDGSSTRRRPRGPASPRTCTTTSASSSSSYRWGSARSRAPSGEIQDAETQEALATLEADTQRVFEALRRLSHDFHPATLRLLGLAAALRTHCAEVAEHHGVEVAFKAREGIPGAVDKDVAVCFFRITQEALRNGIVHGGAAPPLRLPGGRGRAPRPRRDRRRHGIRRLVRVSRRGRAGPGDDERTGPRRRRHGRHREPAG